MGSTNGLLHDGVRMLSKLLTEDDLIRIDDGVETLLNGVLFMFFLRRLKISGRCTRREEGWRLP